MPDRFTPKQLARMEAEARRFCDGRITVRTSGDRVAIADLTQRFFSDDGCGDGHDLFADVTQMLEVAERKSAKEAFDEFLKPRHVPRNWSRRKNVAAIERLFEIVERDLQRPFWESRCNDFKAELARVRQDPGLEFAYKCMSWWPLAQKAQEDAIQQRDAALTASAAVSYRRDHGAWPDRLDQLVPRYLSERPLDRFSGKPLRYAQFDGVPRLYSVGFDKLDDGGTPGALPGRYDSPDRPEPWHWSFRWVDNEPTGDLILWPVGPKVIPLDPLPTAEEFNE